MNIDIILSQVPTTNGYGPSGAYSVPFHSLAEVVGDNSNQGPHPTKKTSYSVPSSPTKPLTNVRPKVPSHVVPKTPKKKRRHHSLIDNPETNPMDPVVQHHGGEASPGVLLAAEETVQGLFHQVMLVLAGPIHGFGIGISVCSL
jgi:hypothetical protein